MRTPAADITKWDCQVSGAEDLTVGKAFSLSCAGPEAPFSSTAVGVQTSEGDHLFVVPLEVLKSTPTEYQAIVTGYRPGDASRQSFYLTDGKERVELQNVSFVMKSVLQGQQEPYPQYPPWAMSFPLWFWLALASVILVSLAGILWRLHARKVFARLMKEAKSYKTNRPAVDEFYKELRQLEKKSEKEQLSVTSQVVEFEKIFRIYLTRHFELPAHVWSLTKVWREIQKLHPKLARKEGTKTSAALLEMSKISTVTLSEKDLKQLMQMVSRVIESIQAFEKQNRSGA